MLQKQLFMLFKSQPVIKITLRLQKNQQQHLHPRRLTLQQTQIQQKIKTQQLYLIQLIAKTLLKILRLTQQIVRILRNLF